MLQEVLADLRWRREAQGLSRRVLAERVGITPSYLARLERSDADPRYTLLADLTRELRTTIGEVFARAEESLTER